MSKLYDADEPETLEAIALTYAGDAEAYRHDNVVKCRDCSVLFDISDGVTSDLLCEDRDLTCGDWVCLECAEELEVVDEREEHGTWYARNGSVVG
jgi:uncharacterized protein YbaR (Trm112 family)